MPNDDPFAAYGGASIDAPQQPTQPTQPADDPFAAYGGASISAPQAPVQAQPVAPPRNDTGVMAGLRRNTVGAIEGVYHALSDPATDQEKAELTHKVNTMRARGQEVPMELATNPSRATLAYHRIIDAPADVLHEKGNDEIEAAKDLLENHHYWKGGNLYLSGLTDKGLSAIPMVGPFVNSIAERAEKGDTSGALTDVVAGKVLQDSPELAKMGSEEFHTAMKARSAARASQGLNTEFLAKAKDLTQAAPPTTKNPYEPHDMHTAMSYLERHHEVPGQEIRGITDKVDALDHEIGNIDEHVRGLVQIIPKEPISTNVIEDVRAGLQDHPKGQTWVGQGMKALKQYADLANPTMEQADELRKQLNAENKAILKKNRYDEATARRTDPGFAAREIAAKSLRDGIYGQLEAHGVQGARELRLDQGSLIKVRNAAEAQRFNGSKTVRGTGPNSIRRELGRDAITGTGLAIGGKVGAIGGAPEVGAGAGAVLGNRLANRLLPANDLTRDALVERAFNRPKSSPVEPAGSSVNLQKPAPAAPTGQSNIPFGPDTLFGENQTSPIPERTPLDKANAHSEREQPHQAVLDDPNATAVQKAGAQGAIDDLRKTPLNKSDIKSAPVAGPDKPSPELLKENADKELERRVQQYRQITEDPTATSTQKAVAHGEIQKVYKAHEKNLKEIADRFEEKDQAATSAKPTAPANKLNKQTKIEESNLSNNKEFMEDTRKTEIERLKKVMRDPKVTPEEFKIAKNQMEQHVDALNGMDDKSLKMMKAEGPSFGEKLGIKYLGLMENVPGKPGAVLYQDPVSGTSVAVKTSEWSLNKLMQKLEKARNDMKK